MGLCLAWPAGAAAQTVLGRGTDITIEERVSRLSQQWADAIANDDFDRLEELMADDYIQIQSTPAGVAFVGKDTQLQGLRRTAGTAARASREVEQSNVRVYGEDTAILTGLAVFTATGPDGQELTNQAVITEVWVNTGDGWQIRHYQPITAQPTGNQAP